jgi:YHS domain-containing protein
MKTISAALIFAVFSAMCAHAQETPQPVAPKETTQEASAVAKVLCPVTGEEADPEITYEYEGTTYSFCCNHCLKKFKADPAKYIKASEKNSFDPCEHEEGAKEKPQHERPADEKPGGSRE